MKQINLGIMAHVDAGKTTITEQLLYLTGSIRSAGSVDKGTAHTDFLSIERNRGISVKAAVTGFRTDNAAFNLIDTPGHMDFSGEVERALWVIDGVILVVSAVEGVQAHTEVIWQALSEKKIPVVFFINKIDRKGADVSGVMEQIQNRLTKNLCLLYEPVNQEENDAGIKKAEICETVAEYDEALCEAYLEGRATEEEAYKIMAELASKAKLYPVLCGSALNGAGIKELTDTVTDCFPDAGATAEDELAGVVFKVEHDSNVGKVAHVRLFGGSLKNRDTVPIAGHDPKKPEKIVQIRKFFGEKYEDTGVLKKGDISAVCGLSDVKVGDIIGKKEGVPVNTKWVEPNLRVSVSPKNETERQALAGALSILSEEDPLLEFYISQNTGEFLISITGVIQAEFLAEIIKERFGVEAVFGDPTVIYKETPKCTGEGKDRYTMPKPCWAVVHFLIEPLPRGSGVVYESKVSPGKIPYRYQNHIATSVPNSLKQGVFGFEVTDIKVTLIDGENHIEHTHPLDFFIATPMALAKALHNTGVNLLEPIMFFRITAAEEMGGKLIGEIINRRGSIENPVIEKGRMTITGKVPVATSIDLQSTVAAITSGGGVLTQTPCGYELCPDGVTASTPFKGVNPIDRSKFILWSRNALGEFGL